jgi:hypothetical protein
MWCVDGKNDVNSDVRDGVKSPTPRLQRDTSSSDGGSSVTEVDGGNDLGRADNTGRMISNTTILQVNSRLILDSPDSSLVEGIETPLREMVFGGMEGNSYSPQCIVYMYLYLYVCMHVYIYSIYIYTNVYRHSSIYGILYIHTYIHTYI